jgi:hypothetical protein
MANTTIALRSSGTAAATPSLGVLANGELSINYADGIIYYKTASNTLGSIRTTQPAGLTTEIQFNDAGAFGSNASLTFNKTISTLNVTNINVATSLTATSITTGSGVGGIIAGANVIYSNIFVANSTTTSISNSTGAIISNGGLGVKGNVYADAVYDGGVEVILFANQAFNQANSANVLAQSAFNSSNTKLSLSGGTISGNVTANSFIANTSVYSPVFYSPAAGSRLELSDIGLVGITVAGQTFQFGASGIESNQGIFGGSYGGNRLSLNNETNLISNRYDTVKIQTGTDGTTVNDFIFANNSLTVPGLFTTVSTNITSTTASTSNTTGALKVAGGIGVKGNVSANGIIFDDGTRQTTAASAGASIGDVLALAIALG